MCKCAAGKMVRKEIQDGKEILRVSGKVDAANADLFEKEIFAAIENTENVVFDLKEMEYISSAGLRVLLKVRKAAGKVSLINVSAEVFEILGMTGFSELMDVRRKRRRISAEGCAEIARGAMGVIYRLDQDTILKVFDPSVTLESLYQARDILKKLFIHDIPCAIPFDIVDVEESHGCVYEMIDADTLAQYINKHPDEAEECGRKAAALMKSLHQGELPAGLLPDAKDLADSWLEQLKAYLTEEDIAEYRKIFAGFKDTPNLLHLDFHPKNIMIKGDSLMIIDLDDACIGDPMIDIACLMMTIGNDKWDDALCRRFIGLSREMRIRYTRAFFRAYFETEDDEKIAEILRPLQPVTALRRLYAKAHALGLSPEDRQAQIRSSQAEVHSLLY